MLQTTDIWIFHEWVSLFLWIWSANLSFTLTWRLFLVYFSPRYKLFLPPGIAGGCLCQDKTRRQQLAPLPPWIYFALFAPYFGIYTEFGTDPTKRKGVSSIDILTHSLRFRCVLAHRKQALAQTVYLSAMKRNPFTNPHCSEPWTGFTEQSTSAPFDAKSLDFGKTDMPTCDQSIIKDNSIGYKTVFDKTWIL